MTRPFDPTTGDHGSEYGRLLAERDRLIADGADPDELLVPRRPSADPFRAPDTDTEPHVPEYEAEKWPVGWDFLAAVVIAGACIAFGWWAFLR